MAEARSSRFARPFVRREASRLQSVREIASLVYAGSDLETIFERIAAAVCHRTLWARSGVMAVDRTTGYSVLISRFDPATEGNSNLPQQWDLSTSPSLRVVETKQPVIIEDAPLSNEFPGYRDDAIARGYRTVVVLPLSCADIQGRDLVLSVSSRERLTVSEDEIDFLMTICHLAALAVDKAKSLHAERTLTSRFERTLQINSHLLERVLAGDSLQTIAGIVETILPDPLLILDFTTDSWIVNRSPDADRFGDREWSELVRGPAAKHLVKLVQQSEPSDFRQLRLVDLSEACGSFRREGYVEPLRVNEETVGALLIFPRRCRLDGLDLLIAQEAKFALSAQLMRSHIQLRRQASELSDLFGRLFEGSWSDPRQLSNRAERLGVDLSAPAQLVAVKLEPGPAGLRSRSPLRSMLRVVQQLRPKAIVIEQVDLLLIVLPDPPQTPKEFDSTFGRQLVETISWHEGVVPMVAVGPICRKLEDYRSARTQCGHLLTLAQMANRAGVVHYEHFGPFAVLMSTLDNAVLQKFLQDTVGRLERYDRDHGMQLLQTASAFIDHGCRYQGTAQALGIHVSTLRYRLTRIRELFDFDLERAETRFSLALALRLQLMLTSADWVRPAP